MLHANARRKSQDAVPERHSCVVATPPTDRRSRVTFDDHASPPVALLPPGTLRDALSRRRDGMGEVGKFRHYRISFDETDFLSGLYLIYCRRVELLDGIYLCPLGYI